MRQILKVMAIGSAALVALVGLAEAVVSPEEIVPTCPVDSVLSGTGCMDTYEASVWRVPNATTTNQALVAKIQQGTATVASLTAGGATQLGTAANDYAPCEKSGRKCANDIYAVSLSGVKPSVFITWFQAQQACANAGKRLPSNAEWQSAVAGTPGAGPDDGANDCNTASGMRLPAGSRSRCVSAVGAFDMVGNISEWVADWGPRSLTCRQWSTLASPTGDAQCLVGARTTEEPGAWMRGGQYETMSSGPLAIEAENGPSRSGGDVGFRCIGTTIATVASPDLIEAALTTSPPAPSQAPGTTLSVTDTVDNLGPGPAGPTITRYYLSLDAVRGPGDILLTGARAVPALSPDTSHSGTVVVTIPATTPLNTYFLLACADELASVAETDEGNNCSGSPSAIVTVARPDLVATTVATDPAAPVRAPGTTFSVTDTVKDIGPAPSGPSVIRYYLSLDPVKGAGDILIGARAVPALAAGASQSGTVVVGIPAATPLNTYYLVACADDLNAVVETSETNNCTASPTASIKVAGPDLVAMAAAPNPPAASAAPGTVLAVTDTTKNAGVVVSRASATRYYLSLDAVKSAGDILLIGGRAVPVLAAGASHSGAVAVTVPTTTPLNTYYLLACADDTNVVVEEREDNNCVASTTASVTITRPDVVENAVSAPPATKARGTGFAVTDTAQNLAAVASAASVTRYYLSLDPTKSAGDIVLGGRAVPALAAGASHVGTVTVTIPAVTQPNTYFLLACADDLNAVVETNEGNNCKPSSTTVIVTP